MRNQYGPNLEKQVESNRVYEKIAKRIFYFALGGALLWGVLEGTKDYNKTPDINSIRQSGQVQFEPNYIDANESGYDKLK
jgi:hypothetical protein